ncbi:MAG: hypothetical protein M3487_13450, partial [Actinomycetota bacterium]|nr:hypothetical protein [Actinomycetota bacterium]
MVALVAFLGFVVVVGGTALALAVALRVRRLGVTGASGSPADAAGDVCVTACLTALVERLAACFVGAGAASAAGDGATVVSGAVFFAARFRPEAFFTGVSATAAAGSCVAARLRAVRLAGSG